MEIAAIIEEKRIVSGTRMNAASSRSHFLIKLKMYRKTGTKIHVNQWQFLDMAGSERPDKTGTTGAETLQAIFTNYSIVRFSSILEALGRMKPLTGGDKLPNGIPWKEVAIT